MLAWGAPRDTGYPIGGPLSFARAIETRYRELGGEIRYESRVVRILVEDQRAVGVELQNGEQHRADVVISAGDGRTALFDLLGGRFLDHALRERFATLPRFPSLVRISLGVARDRLARDVIGALDRRWPGFAGQVEVTDVATPVTYERYTANWNGSMEGWVLTTRSLMMRMPDTVPGLSGFHMIGQCVQPGGGLPPAAMSGRNVIRALCEREGKAFHTTRSVATG